VRRVKRLFALLVAVGLLAVVPPAGAADPPVRVSTSAIWSWWSSPQAVDVGGVTFWTGITDTGSRRVYRTVDGVTTYFNLGASAPDDHNTPALSMLDDHPTVVGYTEHPGPVKIRTAPAGTIEFGDPVVVPFGFESTYVQILRRGAEGIIITRAEDAFLGWQYVTTSDDFETFSAPRMLFATSYEGATHLVPFQGYMQARPFDLDPQSFHLVLTGHPRDSFPIGYTSFTFDELLDPAFMPVELWASERVWEPSITGNPGQKVRVFDVGDKNGLPLVYYARWNDVTTIPQYYTAVRQPDGSWLSTKIVSSGGSFADDMANYVGGIALDRRPGVARFYMAVKDGDVWKLDTFRIDPEGLPFLRVTLDSGPLALARPSSVGDGVIYQRLNSYQTYRYYDSTVYQVKSVAG
jgi:hypothetical protein